MTPICYGLLRYTRTHKVLHDDFKRLWKYSLQLMYIYKEDHATRVDFLTIDTLSLVSGEAQNAHK